MESKKVKNTKAKTQKIERWLPSMDPDLTVVREGDMCGVHFEIVPQPFTNHISYSISCSSVKILAAVERMQSENIPLLIEYACRLKKNYAEFRDNLEEGKKFVIPEAKAHSSTVTYEWLVETVGKQKAKSLLAEFERHCLLYEKDWKKRATLYDQFMASNENIKFTELDQVDLKQETTDAWELDI